MIIVMVFSAGVLLGPCLDWAVHCTGFTSKSTQPGAGMGLLAEDVGVFFAAKNSARSAASAEDSGAGEPAAQTLGNSNGGGFGALGCRLSPTCGTARQECDTLGPVSMHLNNNDAL
jgi:hypothetical protein